MRSLVDATAILANILLAIACVCVIGLVAMLFANWVRI